MNILNDLQQVDVSATPDGVASISLSGRWAEFPRTNQVDAPCWHRACRHAAKEAT
jgi:hypothetical protein